jgi:hypothetical protein
MLPEYIEAFLYFWLLVLLGGVFIFIFIGFIIGLLKLFQKLFKREEKKFLELASIKKTLKILLLLYVFSMVFFYIERAGTYLSGDRAHKEAKAYAIAGEYLFLWQAGVLNLSSPESIVVQPINTLQKYLLQKIRAHISKDDAEYEIWNYKFNLIQYAGTMYAPMTEESKQKGLHFTNGAASMKPELLEILNQLFNAMQTLSQGKIKDKEFSQIDRYLVIASMAPYYERYMSYQATLESNLKDSRYIEKKWMKFYHDEILRKEFIQYLTYLDDTYQAIEKNVELMNAFEAHPKIKASLFWGLTKGYLGLSNLQADEDNVYPCTNPNFLKFVKYYKSYVDWAYMSPKSSFKTLSKRQKKTYDFLIENQNSGYYIAKYICKLPFDYMTKREASIESRYRQSSFSRSMEDRPNIKHIREIEKNLTQWHCTTLDIIKR